VTPINDPEDAKVHDMDIFTYDGEYNSNDRRGDGGGYATQPQYNYGWDF